MPPSSPLPRRVTEDDDHIECRSDAHYTHRYLVTDRIAERATAFQHVEIVRTRKFGAALFIDGVIQSSEYDEYVYHEALVHPGLLAHADPHRVLILGGGEGAALREVLKHRTVDHATMVDIDSELVGLCRHHLPSWSLGAFADPRTTLVTADGKAWLEQHDHTFDVIIMDLTDQIDLGPSFGLYTQEFYRTVLKRLRPDGILVVQAGELSPCDYFSHCSIAKTLRSVFAHVQTYTYAIP
jgi:spermidine synthase